MFSYSAPIWETFYEVQWNKNFKQLHTYLDKPVEINQNNIETKKLSEETINTKIYFIRFISGNANYYASKKVKREKPKSYGTEQIK